jgi:hypothetical protein
MPFHMFWAFTCRWRGKKKKGARRDARERLGLPAIGCPGDRRLVASEADVGKYSCLQPGQVPRYLATYLIQ